MKNIKIKLIGLLFQSLNLIFAFITISLLVVALFRPDLISLFLDWLWVKINSLWSWNYLIAFTSSIIESFPVLGVLIPGQQIMLMVGWFFWKNNLFLIIVVSSIGALIWNYIWYFAWVKFWSDFLKKYWEWFWIGKTELKILKRQIEKNWAWFIIFWKFHNFTRAFIPFIAGSSWMHPKKFWLYNFIWSVLWATTIIILWVVFIQFYKELLKYIQYIIIWIAAIVAVYVYFFKKKEFLQYLKDKNEEIDEKIKNKE